MSDKISLIFYFKNIWLQFPCQYISKQDSELWRFDPRWHPAHHDRRVSHRFPCVLCLSQVRANGKMYFCLFVCVDVLMCCVCCIFTVYVQPMLQPQRINVCLPTLCDPCLWSWLGCALFCLDNLLFISLSLCVKLYFSFWHYFTHFFHISVWYVRACVFCLAGHLSHSVNPHDSYTPTPYHVLPVFFSSFLFSLPIANHLLMIMSLLKDEYTLLWNQSHHIFACNLEQQNVLLISVADSLVAYRLKYSDISCVSTKTPKTCKAMCLPRAQLEPINIFAV